MAAYSKASVNRPSGMPGAGINPMNKLILIDCDDIDSMPPRDADGVTVGSSSTGGSIELKSSTTAIAIYFTPGSCNTSSNSEGDADAEGFKPTIQVAHPGNELDIRKFKANWVGKNIIALIQYCDKDVVDIFGSPCNPMRLQVNYEGSSEANRNQLTFEQAYKGHDIGVYAGTLPTLDTDS